MSLDMESLARQYGFRVVMVSDKAPEGFEFYAYLEPTDATDADKTAINSRAGIRDGEKFLIMAAMDSFSAAERGAKLECEGQCFELLRAERRGFAGEFTHWEGVLRRIGRTESDG